MFCEKCGTEILQDSIVCPNCGTPIDQKLENPKVVLQKEKDIQKEQEDIQREQEDKQTEQKDILEEQTVFGEEKNSGEEEKKDTAEQEEDILQFSDTSMKSGVTSYEEPIFPETPKKKGKGSIIAVCTLAGAVIILVLYLVVSLFAKDNMSNYVKKAFINTAKSLAKGNNTTVSQILLSDVYSQNMNLTVRKFEMEEYGETINTGIEPRISIGGTVDNKNKTALANIGFGFSDMNDIQMELYFEKNKFYFGFPDLYDKFFLVTDDDLEFDMENIIQQRPEAIKSLAETLSKEVLNIYKNIQFVKTDKITLHGNTDIKTQEIRMLMKAKDYNQFLDSLSEIIKNDTIFMDWIVSLSSGYEKEDFIEGLEEIIEELKVTEETENVTICYLYIDEKQKQVVGFRIPLDNPEEETEGAIIFYLLGEDKLTDYIEYDVDVTSYGYNSHVSVINTKEEEGYHLFITAESDEEEFLNISCDYDNIENQDSFITNIKEISLNINDGYNTISAILDGSYETKKIESLVIPSQNSVDVMEMSDIEIQEAVLTIMQNMLDKNYVPSSLRADFQKLIEELIGKKSSVGSDLDGSDNLTYEEFKQVIQEVYGDIYSEEELQQLYQNLYGEDSMSDYENTKQ